MLTQALDIDFTVTDTALEAALPRSTRSKRSILRTTFICAIGARGSRVARSTRRPKPAMSNIRSVRSPQQCVHGSAPSASSSSGDASPITRLERCSCPWHSRPKRRCFSRGWRRSRGSMRSKARSSRDPISVRLGFRLSIAQQDEPETPRMIRASGCAASSTPRAEHRNGRKASRARALAHDSLGIEVEIEDRALRRFDIRRGVISVATDEPRGGPKHGPVDRASASVRCGRYDRLRVQHRLRPCRIRGRLVESSCAKNANG